MIIIKHITRWFCPFEELSYRSLVEKRHAEDPEHIKSTSIETKFMFNNGNKATCRNCGKSYDPVEGLLEVLFIQHPPLHTQLENDRRS